MLPRLWCAVFFLINFLFFQVFQGKEQVVDVHHDAGSCGSDISSGFSERFVQWVSYRNMFFP